MLEEVELYEALCKRHTRQKQELLKNAKVTIAGLGGLSSNVAMALTRLGVGNLRLIDFDVVDITNIFRQNYRLHHIGKYKTECMKEQIAEINPYINVEIINETVNEENVIKLIGDSKFICEAFDNRETKAMFINKIMEMSEDKIVVSGSGMAGIGSANEIVTKKITNRLYICGDGINGIEKGLQLMAPHVALCAMHEANMVMRLILGQTD